MTVPGVWQLVRADRECSRDHQQRINRQCECPDRITTAGGTGYGINDRGSQVKHMTVPAVWQLIGADGKRPGNCE